MMATTHRLTATAALASFLASLTLVPLVKGSAWLVAVIIIVTVLAVTGAATRHLVSWWPVAVLSQTLTALLVLTNLFARDTVILGFLPGPTSLEVFGDLFRTGMAVTRGEVPPVSSGHGIILLITTGIGAIALLVDIIAVSLRKPAAAGLPLLAVYCVPAVVLPGGIDWWWFALGAIGFLVLVSADAGDRLHQWGRVLGSEGDPAGARALNGPLAGGRRLAIGGVIAAVLLPAAVPGLDSRLLGERTDQPGQGRGGNITVINPILRIRENLTQRNNTVVLRYTTTVTSPDPLRIVSDDVFDGKQWSPSVGAIPRSNLVQNGLPTAPGLTPAISRTALRTEFQTLDLRQTYLPLPYPTTKVDINGPWLYDARTLNVVGDRVTTLNLQYTAQHLAVAPTTEQLRAAPAPPQAMLDSYGKLPPTSPREIRDTARRIAGNTNPYEQAIALQQWFRSGGGFTYSETVLPPPGKEASSQDAVVAFLRNKQGYCVQFASAMAVMARTLGIPSRVGVGFLPGKRRTDGSWEISIHDAHAWPELYFSTAGWVRFEPTPGVRAGTAPEWAQPQRDTPQQAAAIPTTHAAAPATQVPRPAQPRPPKAAKKADPPIWQRVLDAVPWRAIGIVLLIVALAGVPWGVARGLRWLRWRRVKSGPPANRVEAAWDELRERLEDLGIRWAVSWTPRALQRRLTTDYALEGSELDAVARLVTDVEGVRYAPPGSLVREIAALRADVDLVLAKVAASATVSDWARRRAHWLPGSGWQVLSAAVHRADVAADEAGRRVGDGVGSSVRRLVRRP